MSITNLAGMNDFGTLERVIRITLLLPTDQKTLDLLTPTALSAEELARQNIAQNTDLDWMPVALALWKYRNGDYADSAVWCERCLAGKTPNVTRDAIASLILAMAKNQLGQFEGARSQLNASRVLIENKFKSNLERGSSQTGYWFDWVFAHVLLREATALIKGGIPRSASTPAIAH